MCQWRVVAAVLLVAGLGVCARLLAQQRPPGNPPLVIDSLYGPDVFAFSCAPCHGRDAKGGGPVAAALHTRPADLTTIARRNGGAFPKARIEAMVTHGTAGPEAHGTTEMPVWGLVFGSLDPSQARVKTRIANLVTYIESIQVK
jgi:mono/diheme cytochrome c family protein